MFGSKRSVSRSSRTDEDEAVISPIKKFKKREPLDFQELPDFCFEITVDKSGGLGVRFGWTSDQQVVVQKFLAISNGDAGPWKHRSESVWGTSC